MKLISKFPRLIKGILILMLAFPLARYLMYQQKVKETAIYSSVYEIKKAAQEDIYQLKLEYKNYQQLPDFIFEYTKLRALHLGFNRLQCFDSRITQMSSLEVLSLSGGMRSAQEWEALADAGVALDSAAIYNQIASLPEELGQLQNLKSLDLRNNRLSELPQSIGQLVYLEQLSIQGNFIEVLPQSINQLAQLKTLTCYSNKLYRLPSLGQLQALEQLEVYKNRLIALPLDIGSLKQLKKLSAQHNQLQYLPASLGDCAALQSLNVSDNKLHAIPKTLFQSQHLETLKATDNLLDSLPSYYWNAPNLSSLDLSRNRIHQLQTDSNAQAPLIYLNLSHNQIENLPEHWHLQQLEMLVLQHNQLQQIPSCIYQIKSLRHLDLRANKITTLDLESLLAMPHLKELYLQGNPLKPDLIEQLSKLEEAGIQVYL